MKEEIKKQNLVKKAIQEKKNSLGKKIHSHDISNDVSRRARECFPTRRVVEDNTIKQEIREKIEPDVDTI